MTDDGDRNGERMFGTFTQAAAALRSLTVARWGTVGILSR